jgi:hypothetical protein
MKIILRKSLRFILDLFNLLRIIIIILELEDKK